MSEARIAPGARWSREDWVELAVGRLKAGGAAALTVADTAREAIIADLLARAYGLGAAEAADVARVFHSLQLAAQLRTPDDVAGFSAGPARRLTAWLEAAAG